MPEANKPKQNIQNVNQRQANPEINAKQTSNIADEIIKTINKNKKLRNYPIRELVKDAEAFGSYLKQQRLETNQVRKFLDAINRLKSDLADNKGDFSKIETEVVLLKPKLAYAAARQKSAKPLSDVMSAAIDEVYSKEDFDRLVQLIESIIAYHKAEGGR
jgi:CRISPR-associated protein Csm2